MRKLTVLLGLLAILSVLAACAQPTPEVRVEEKVIEKTVVVEKEVEKTVIVEKKVIVTPTPPPPGPKTLVVCMAQEPETLYTYGGSMLVQRAVLHGLEEEPYTGLTYDFQPKGLVKLPNLKDGDAEIRKVIVKPGDKYVNENDEIVEATEEMELEQMVVTFKMKPGQKWEDGTPVTAKDSVFSFNLAKHPDTPVNKYTEDRTAEYKALDELTTQWIGLPGYKDFTYFLNFWSPLPEHVLGEYYPDRVAEILESDFSRDPLSYGPFTLEEWVAGDHITLKKNPNYYRAAEGLPRVDTVIFRFIPDTNNLLAQLLAGQCDIGTQDGMDLNQSPFLKQAEQQGILKPVFQTGTVWEHIDFNIWPVDDRIAFGACLEVRKAIAYGTDRQAMVDQVLYGESKVLHSYIPPEHPEYPGDENLTTYPYDPEKAMQILEEAGWRDEDGDGIREAHGVTCTRVDFNTREPQEYKIPDGTPLRMTLNTTSGNKMREQVTQLFQQNMKDIGIDIELEYLPASVYFADGPDGPLFGRRFDLGEFAWLTGVTPPGFLYHCDNVPTPENNWGGQNETAWCDDAYSKAVSNALQELDDEKRSEYWAEAQKIFSEQLPVLPLFARIKVAATRPEVKNFRVDPTQNSELYNIEEIDIEQ